jgi:hypothetical protein
MCDGNCAANQFLDEYDQPLPFLPERLFALEYQKHSLPQPDIFPVCVTFASVMFPAPAVILSCVAIVESVALSVVGCASEAVVSTSENVIPVAKTNNTRTFDFVIHFIKEDLLYKKLPRLPILKKDSSAALTTVIFGFDNVFNFCFSRHTM